MRCFFGFTLVSPCVTHISGAICVALAQVVGQVAPGRELGLRDGQRLAALPARLEGDAEEGVVEVQVDAARRCAHTEWPAWLALLSSSTTRYTRPKRSIR